VLKSEEGRNAHACPADAEGGIMEALMSLVRDNMMGIMVVTLLFIALPTTIIVNIWMRKKATAASWEKFSHSGGHRFHRGNIFDSPSVTGEHRGFSFRLFSFTISHRHHMQHCMGLEFFLPREAGFMVTLNDQRRMASMVYRALGGQDITTGDPEFDRAFVVKSDTPAKAVALLGPAIRGDILGQGDAFWAMVLHGKSLTFWYTELGFDPARALATAGQVASAAVDIPRK
jgi:hypothetical protein